MCYLTGTLLFVVFLFHRTLGCRFVSCSMVMGSGSGTAWPTRVGPNTLAKLFTSILVSTLSETLGEKKRGRFHSVLSIMKVKLYCRKVMGLDGSKRKTAMNLKLRLKCKKNYFCRWIIRNASVSLLGWGRSPMVWYNMARLLSSSWISKKKH